MGHFPFVEKVDSVTADGTAAGARSLYDKLHDDDRAEYGYDGLGGGIGCTYGMRIIATDPVSPAEAQHLVDARTRDADRESLTFVIPVLEHTEAVFGDFVTVDVEVTVTAEVFHDTKQLLAAVAKKAGITTNDHTTVRVKAEAEKNRFFARPRTLPVGTAVKAAAKATAGATTTRYFILVNGQCTFDWDRGYVSQAAARAGLVTDVTVKAALATQPSADVEVVSMTRRTSGEALVAGKVSAGTVTEEFQLKYRNQLSPATTGKKQGSWWFFGSVHH